MHQFVFVLFVFLQCYFAMAVDADEQKATDHNANSLLLDLVRMQGAFFKREVTIADSPGYIRPIYTDVLPMISPLLKESARYAENPIQPYLAKAQAIKDTLDRMNIWNKVVYLGVNPKGVDKFSPFLFGAEHNRSEQWANLVAVKDRNYGVVQLMVVDMMVSSEPLSLHDWFNKLVAGNNMFDSEHKQSCHHLDRDMLPEPRIPIKKDLHLVIDDLFYPNRNSWRFD